MTKLSLLMMTLGFGLGLVTAPATAMADRAAVDGAPVEGLLRSLDAAVAAHDLDGVVAAYDPSATALVARQKAAAQGWNALADARVTHRAASVSGDAEAIEAVVLRKVTFTEHGRVQVDLGWETVGLRRLGAGWRIASQEERSYLRARTTELTIELRPEAGTMRGTSRLELEVSEPGEDSVLLTLNRGLAIKTLSDDEGRAVRFERAADTIAIAEDRGLRSGDRRTFEITFEGQLFNEAKEQGYSQVAITPGGSFASWVTSWYPLLGGGGSKSKGRITYDVPAGITVASSGRLASREMREGRTREVFTIDRPLDFSFAAAKYFHRERTVDGAHLGVYLLGGGDAKAALYIEEAARTLRCERGLYGAYPFDGYAIVEIPAAETGVLGGSSEQGMNLFPTGVLPDAAFPLLLLAHEIGHSWWGNLVGSGDGPMIDEGLAQMSAVMCLRERRGEAAMRSFLRHGVPGYGQSAAMYFARFAGAGNDVALGVPPAGADARAALHDLADTKGMLVYAMLRDAIGPTAFVAGLRSVVERFAGKDAGLGDLRAAWEAASGKDLRAFFAQWLERTGAAELALEARIEPAGAGFVVAGVITQLGDTYDLSVEIALGHKGRNETRTVAISAATTPFSFRVARRPDFVALDPSEKILRWTPALRHGDLLRDGLALAGAGQRDAGCEKIAAFVAAAPDSMEGRYRAGVCAEERGALDAAAQTFRWVLDRHASLGIVEPAVSLAELHLGYVHDLAGRRDAARAAYRKVLRSPDASEAHDLARAAIATPHR